MKKLFLFFLFLYLGVLITAVHASQTHAAVYKNIYPNIDLKVNEDENYAQYQWEIKPGGSVEDIRFENKNSIPCESGHWTFQKPLAYQVMEGKQVHVDIDIISREKNSLGFNVRNYNQNAGLSIRCDVEKCYGVSNFISWDSTGTASASGTTYYIRTDGGTATQCIGTTDAPYPGSGTNQPCAWSHPFWALNSSGNWKIQGGDTIIIGPGSYKMGYGAPNTSWCEAGGAYECNLPPLPSGPSADKPTRILGKKWDSGCSAPPELWGSQRPWQIIDLTGSSNVYIGCLEITDHSNCVEFHSNPSVSCERDTYPFGDWASDGILAADSSNVTLKNLDIHGLASAGIRAGRLSNWTVENVRVAGNGWVGWEGDIEEIDSNSGSIHFKDFIVEWNGCGETYPGGQPHNCWSQTAGGYGDGLGTGATGGHWIFEDSIFRYNTSDGLDLLYARNPGSQIEIKRTMAYGNAGNAIKVNGDTAMENCLMVGNCGFFHGKSFTYNVDDCRALGSPLAFNLRKGTSFSMVNSTIVGQGDCLMTGECDDGSCDGSEKIIIKNNAFQGYPDYTSPGDTTCYIWFDRFDFYNTQMDYNIVYKTKISDELSLSAHDLTQNPLFVNDNLASFNGHLQSNSPAIDSGLAVGSLSGLIPADDIEGNSRPSGAGVDRGAYEYQSSIPTPTITVTSPNGGESWAAGSIHNVTWTTSSSVGNIRIQYSVNNGSSWASITSSTANDGSYSWTVPNVSSSQCLVMVSETDGSPTDNSNSVFSITSGSSNNPVIALSRTTFFFGAFGQTTKTSSQTFLISNTGNGTLNWSASTNKSWLSCSPGSGADAGAVTVGVDPSYLYPGTYTGKVSVSDSNAINSPQTVSVTLNVYGSSGNSPPFGSFDTPTNRATVMSSIPVTGWVLDDIEVSQVQIYRRSNGALVYIGNAVFVEGARPDVEEAYPDYPLNYRAGWGYMMLTNFLPNGGNGTFTIYAIATDIEGNQETLGTKTIYCENDNAVKPFGAIDTPTQGGNVSCGSFINWGWVLTPLPNKIPTDGSTINVYVDGVNLGHPTYNLYRSDIASLFPGYANSNGAAGYFTMDTTAFENGVHTLQWTATDNAGNIDGIGSRYFNFQCTGESLVLTAQSAERRVSPAEYPLNGAGDYLGGIRVKKGYNEDTESRQIYPDENEMITIKIKELERLEIHIPEGTKGLAPLSRYTGYHVVGPQLRPLPIGSYLDSERGIFYWQPGVGYIGEYQLVFIKRGNTNGMKKISLLVKINPKF
jgi:hypothetical protein